MMDRSRQSEYEAAPASIADESAAEKIARSAGWVDTTIEAAMIFRCMSASGSLPLSPAAALGKSAVLDPISPQRREQAPRCTDARSSDVTRLAPELVMPPLSFPQLFPNWANTPDDSFTRGVAAVRRVFGFTMALCLLAVIFPGTQIPLGQKVLTFLYVIFATVATYQSRSNTDRVGASTRHFAGFVLFTVGNAAFSLLTSHDLARGLFWVLWLPGLYIERVTILGPKDLRLPLAAVGLSAVTCISYLLWARLQYSFATRILLIIPAAHVGSVCLLYLLTTMGERFEVLVRGRAALMKASEAAERQLNAERAATQQQLERINRSLTLGALGASIAHEINQPLASIVTNAGAAARWLREEHLDLDEARRAIARVVQDGHRTGAVIASFRAILSEREPQRALLQANALVKEALDILAPEIQQRDVVVLTPALEDLPSIRGNRIQLRQVFLNLITNALDAMAEMIDRPRLLIIRCERDHSMGIAISIEDSGPGIGVKDPKKIFEAFFTTKSSGMGMGLFICRMIIEAHGGTLKVESRPGRTKFCVRLAVESDAHGRRIAE